MSSDIIDLSSITYKHAEPESVVPQPIPQPVSRHVELPVVEPQPEGKVVPKKTKSKVKDESEDTEKLREQIRLYFATFPKKLKSLSTAAKVDKMDLAELQDLKNKINVQVGSKSTVEMVAYTVPMALRQFEELVSTFTPAQIRGASSICNDEDFMDLIKCEIIETGYGLNISNRQRLFFNYSAQCIKAHLFNTQVLARDLAANTPREDDPESADL